MIGTDKSIIAGIEGRHIRQGLIFGKFMPPTNGHLYLANFARGCCEKLTIVVCSLPDEPIPGNLRYQWMKEIFPDCNIVHLDKVMPQEPASLEDRPFFQLWGDTLSSYCPEGKFDALFASESYGYRVADVMGIKFIPVDTAREMVDISGTAVREHPLRHWERLHPVVRPYFLKRVALLGREAPEKTALLKKLAAYFNTSFAANYAENISAEFSNNIPDYSNASLALADISTIARGQMASEAALAREARKILFAGSELKSIAKASITLFGNCPAWVEEEAEKTDYDLYLVINPDESGWWSDSGSPKENITVLCQPDIDKKFDRAIEVILSLWPDSRRA